MRDACRVRQDRLLTGEGSVQDHRVSEQLEVESIEIMRTRDIWGTVCESFVPRQVAVLTMLHFTFEETEGPGRRSSWTHCRPP